MRLVNVNRAVYDKLKAEGKLSRYPEFAKQFSSLKDGALALDPALFSDEAPRLNFIRGQQALSSQVRGVI